MMKKNITTTILAITMALILTACSGSSDNMENTTTDTLTTESSVSDNNSTSTENASYTSLSTVTKEYTDVDELFSKRDLNQTPDLSDAETTDVEDNKTYTITEAGTYIFTGSATNTTIKVEADKEDKVQIVLDNLNITNENFPAIYVVSCDKCFVTTSEDTSTLSVSGTFTADGDTKTDAVIFSKDDLVFNGTGTLNIVSNNGNGISGKDDIKFTGGTYNIECKEDAVEANDSIAIYDGNFNITTKKDGFHSENDDDNTVGFIYIKNGSFNINSQSDAIQATTYVQIDGGSFTITAREGIEATYVLINDGSINISASDDGINASNKSSAYSIPVIEINGGNLVIVMGDGDTDGIDANGNIIVNGGTIDVTAKMSSFDYDNTAEFNGGTIIVNGEEVDEIPQSMMGGPGGPGGNGNFGGGFPGGGFPGKKS